MMGGWMDEDRPSSRPVEGDGRTIDGKLHTWRDGVGWVRATDDDAGELRDFDTSKLGPVRIDMDERTRKWRTADTMLRERYGAYVDPDRLMRTDPVAKAIHECAVTLVAELLP